MTGSDRIVNLYFDNAAAEIPSPEILRRFCELMQAYPGNQEALGFHALEAKKAIRKAEALLLESLGISPAEYGIVWACTGTDAIQAAFRAMPLAVRGGDVIWSAADHAAVAAAIRILPAGFHGMETGLTREGLLDFASMKKKLSSRTVLLSATLVQPETGAIQDLAALRNLQKQLAPDAVFSADLVQAIGKIPVKWEFVRPDLAFISGQKLGCPGGAAVIVSNALLRHVRRIRSEFHSIGRVLPAQCILLAEQVHDRIRTLSDNGKILAQLKKTFFDELASGIPDQFRKTLPDSTPASPAIAHILLTGKKITVQGAIAVRQLAARNVSAAPGSACGAETPEPSRVLRAMGIPVEEAYSALRVSFSPQQTPDDVRELVRNLKKTLSEY